MLLSFYFLIRLIINVDITFKIEQNKGTTLLSYVIGKKLKKIPSVNLNYEERNYEERNYEERNSIERDSNEKDSIERNLLDKDSIERDSLDRDSIDRDSIDKDSIDIKLMMNTSEDPTCWVHACFIKRLKVDNEGRGKLLLYDYLPVRCNYCVMVVDNNEETHFSNSYYYDGVNTIINNLQ